MARVVRRELGGGVVVDADQVADRVAVLDPVEPADGDAARVGVRPDRSRRPTYLIQSSRSRRSWSDGRGLPAGGMMPGPHVLQHGPPELLVGHCCRIEVHTPFLDPVAVTGEAAVFEDRADLLVELSIRPLRDLRTQECQRQQAQETQDCSRAAPRGDPTGEATQEEFLRFVGRSFQWLASPDVRT